MKKKENKVLRKRKNVVKYCYYILLKNGKKTLSVSGFSRFF